MALKEKEITCPWCNEKTMPNRDMVHKTHVVVVEARCSKCGKILAAYKDSEGAFLPNIRVF